MCLFLLMLKFSSRIMYLRLKHPVPPHLIIVVIYLAFRDISPITPIIVYSEMFVPYVAVCTLWPRFIRIVWCSGSTGILYLIFFALQRFRLNSKRRWYVDITLPNSNTAVFIYLFCLLIFHPLVYNKMIVIPWRTFELFTWINFCIFYYLACVIYSWSSSSATVLEIS